MSTSQSEFHSPEEDNTQAHDNTENGFSELMPRSGFIVTPVIMAINVLVYVVMVFSGVHFMEPTSASLVDWGANFGPYTLDGEWWRLLSSNYIHIGIIHLVMNMYALLYIGTLLEPFLGKIRFSVAYTLTGVMGSVASLWWNDTIVSAGASGAVFGMYGIFLAMLTTSLIEKETRKSLLGSISIFVLFNLGYGLTGGIDNAAHIGGLLSGVIVGYLFTPGIKKQNNFILKYGAIILALSISFGVSYALLNGHKSDILKYQTAMDEFTKHQNNAIQKFPPETVSSTNKNEVLTNLQEGINEWQKCIDVLTEAQSLSVDEKLLQRNKKLQECVKLRQSAFELLYKKYHDDTYQYDAEINQKLDKAAQMVDELNKEVDAE